VCAWAELRLEHVAPAAVGVADYAGSRGPLDGSHGPRLNPLVSCRGNVGAAKPWGAASV
jgi:hypothetical protein